MALPTATQLKTVLRIQGSADDTLVTDLLTRATGVIIGALGRPITSASSTWTDWARTGRDGVLRTLEVPVWPYDPTSLVILDADGATLSSTTDYYQPTSTWASVIHARPGGSFANGPYTLTADVGLSEDARYATVIEPALSAAILDLAADMYQRRSVAATSETSAGGVSTSYDVAAGIPPRVMQAISPWVMVRV